MKYDVAIIGAGPGGIFSAYELTKLAPSLRVAVFEAGHSLEKRHCPIDGKKVKSCIGCKSCSIMSGFGGAGAFSDGKYNITNDFGGTLYEYIGKQQALNLMHYVDEINMLYGGEGTKLYSTAGSQFKKLCIQLLVHTTPTHLCGELRTDAPLAVKYHIAAENERFVREDGVVYRCGEVYRTMVDKTTGNVLSRELLRRNHARVLYDTAGLEIMDR